MKHSYILILFVTLLFSTCTPPYNRSIYILYDNDVHCSVDGYEKMAALRADYLNKSIYVNVVSCGDFVQGNKVGSISKGKYPVAIMNTIPYDYVTLGNHEFDYGLPQMKKLIRGLRAKCLCCNLTDLTTGKDLFASYNIRTYGNTNVLFIGVTTPSTLTASIPTNFMNEQGEVIYDFHEEDVINRVQQAVNAAREQMRIDHVIVLSHLGDDTKGVNSISLIQQTTGIDVVLDGHAHHVINTKVANLNGDSVILASTGSNFKYVGCLHIDETDQKYNTLIDLSQYEGTSERVRDRIESILKKVENQTSQYVGYAQVMLTDHDSLGNRLVRREETNLGDFTADAMRVIAGADMGVCNGGGLRNSIEVGKITYGDLLQVFPFNNSLCKVQVTGQQLMDALTTSVSDLNPESGDFLQVSGLRYVVDMSDRSIVSAELQRDTTWQPICSDSIYTIGGQNYLLVCGGGSGMFNGTQSLPVEHISDVEVLHRYIKLMDDTIRSAQYAQPQQRITFINQD